MPGFEFAEDTFENNFEDFGIDSMEQEYESGDSDTSLCVLFAEKSKDRLDKQIQEIQDNAEGMTKEERGIYFDALDQSIVRLAD